MPWEERPNGGKYYYKAVRIDGRPRRIYLGHGPAGRTHEILDRIQSRKREATRQERLEHEAERDEWNRHWQELMVWLTPLADAAMRLAGWYKHRGQWRKVVMDPRTRQNVPSTASGGPDLLDELDMLSELVNAGDASAKIELQRFLEDHPELYRRLGDLSSVMTATAIRKLAQGDSVQLEMYRQNLEDWKRELLGPNPTAIRRGLVEAALSEKLAMTNAEHAFLSANATAAIAAMKAKTLGQAQHRLTMVLKRLEEVGRAEDSRSKPTSPQPATVGAHSKVG